MVARGRGGGGGVAAGGGRVTVFERLSAGKREIVNPTKIRYEGKLSRKREFDEIRYEGGLWASFLAMRGIAEPRRRRVLARTHKHTPLQFTARKKIYPDEN